MTQTQPERFGAPLRDAAVDPQPGDLLPPTNAGVAGPVGDPHGPHVVAIEVDDPRRHAAVAAQRRDQAAGTPQGAA